MHSALSICKVDTRASGIVRAVFVQGATKNTRTPRKTKKKFPRTKHQQWRQRQAALLSIVIVLINRSHWISPQISPTRCSFPVGTLSLVTCTRMRQLHSNHPRPGLARSGGAAPILAPRGDHGATGDTCSTCLVIVRYLAFG